VTPLKFDGFNRVYKKNELQPEDIPAKREAGVVISRWQPSYAELQILLNGGCIELTVHGGQPAVSLGVV
jgi:hypothetical protein